MSTPKEHPWAGILRAYRSGRARAVWPLIQEACFEIEEAAQVRKHWEQMPGIGWEDSTGRMRAPSVSWVEMETEEYEFWRKDYYRCLGYRASVDGGVVYGDAWRASVWPQEGSEGE